MSEHGGLVGSIPGWAVHFFVSPTRTRDYMPLPRYAEWHTCDWILRTGLLCVLLLLTKVSHACGWQVLPAVWAGCALCETKVHGWHNHTRHGPKSLWLVHTATRIRRNQPRRVVRSLPATTSSQVNVSRAECLPFVFHSFTTIHLQSSWRLIDSWVILVTLVYVTNCTSIVFV